MVNFHAAIAQQNREASLVDFETFLSAFKRLPEPKFSPFIKHPQQVEETEIV